MPDLLKQLGATWEGRGESLGLGRFLLLLALSALAAFLIARLYVRFFGARASGSDLHRAFPLLAIAVTSIFVCIQFSLPLSLGLLGALSIVRFRTPIKEPEEIGFLMIVIATSLAAATGLIAFLGGVLAVAVGALVVQDLVRGYFAASRDGALLIATLDETAYEAGREQLLALLAGAGRRGRIDSVTAQEGVVTVVWRYGSLAAAEIPALERRVAALARPRSLSIVQAGRPSG